MASWTAHIRSYGAETPQERHDFVQFVLPLHGTIELQIEGKGAVIGNDLAAAVSAGAMHSQQAHSRQQALILNVDTSIADDCGVARLEERRYFRQSTQSLQMTKLLARATSSCNAIIGSVPHLIKHCTLGVENPSQALHSIDELVELAPLSGISVSEMALACGVKDSQFHELFRRHFGQSPHQWLVQKRLSAVKLALETTDIALTELAHRSGYSDQSALTRAFRNHFGVPLSEYRRSNRH